MDMLWYGHKYGFVPDADYDLLWNKCGGRYASARASGACSPRPRRSSR